jgi:hypothetical protein
MGRYGTYGRPIPAFEAYIEWRDQTLLEEADSKADFPKWLWGPTRRQVWRGYERIEPQYERYAGIENMPDFRPRLMHGLGRLKGFGYVGDNGEYPGMKRAEIPGPALVIDTYGAVYSITRQAIINDETGELLNRNPTDMGEEAAEFVSETIVALIESNPTAYDGLAFFHATHGNTGVAPLSEDSLADAITWMENQTDQDGRRVRVRPRYLLVKGARNEAIARRILNSTTTGVAVQYTGGTAGVGTAFMDKGTLNPLQGLLPGDAVTREAYLTDVNDWYLFADPRTTPGFSLGFLNGNQKPAVLIKDPSVRNALGAGQDPYTYELDSVDFKVRLDFGCAAVDFRAAFRSVVP